MLHDCDLSTAATLFPPQGASSTALFPGFLVCLFVCLGGFPHPRSTPAQTATGRTFLKGKGKGRRIPCILIHNCAVVMFFSVLQGATWSPLVLLSFSYPLCSACLSLTAPIPGSIFSLCRVFLHPGRWLLYTKDAYFDTVLTPFIEKMPPYAYTPKFVPQFTFIPDIDKSQIYPPSTIGCELNWASLLLLTLS